MRYRFLIPLCLMVMVLVAGLYSCQRESAASVDFNRDVRPVLNEKCLGCHGGVRKQGGLSLLFREEALGETESGKPAIIPGNHEESELYLRLIHEDLEIRMPLEQKPLTKEEVKKISAWIDAGAEWKEHWAYIPPDPGIQPPQPDRSWGYNEIDAFVATKHRELGLQPMPEAPKAKLLRRVYLDLIGLPPGPEAVNEFLNDESPDAYEKIVDQLLASPRFGERWASMWLDLARYGDSQGYQKDPIRPNIWRYRDWVIHAFNQDLPFDQFTIDQLAGDLLDNPTDDQILATTFHRNTNTNDEGGTDDEEFRVVAVLDRLNTTFEVWQGITMGCVQCHGHPYDPIRHEEFYELMAFFNNTADSDKRNEYPRKIVLSPGQRENIKQLQSELDALKTTGDTISEDYKNTLAALLAEKPGSVPVMQDLPDSISRKSHVFVRGNWLVHGEEVEPDVPEIFADMEPDWPSNRLGLAKWLVSTDNPLTRRVIVNRFWTEIWGQGIVETVEDFGSQGALPTYPGLLDWLAVQFSDQWGWSVKRLLKEIVLSAAYRQSSDVSAKVLELDPRNQLLTRGPRIRLTAEQIRDQALSVSGLLSDKMYGPSVMPYQPEGVWNTIRQVARWQTSPGEDQFRRGVYTFMRKTSPYPSMITFDAPSREFCISRRIRTNTPLQAMVTLNDPVFMDAAKALAQSVSHQDNPIEAMYQRALLRPADDHALERLQSFYQKTLQQYQEDTTLVADLIEDPELQQPEYAALINVANVILNLDEFLTKN